MATLKEILRISGDLETAENIAVNLIATQGNQYLLDLELILSAQGRPDEAYEVSKKAIEVDPMDHRAAFNHAWHMIRQGDLLNGYRQLRRGRFAGIYAKPYIDTDKSVWDGQEDISGKTVLFHCECGLGDEIIQVRFVKNLIEKDAKVIIGCSDSLMSVFNRIDGVSAVVDKNYSGRVQFDYWIPSMNAVDIIGIGYEALSNTPYLTADPYYVEKWNQIIPDTDKLKVGIRWAGNACYEEELWRTIPPNDLINTVTMPWVEIYSLQRDDNMIDLPSHVTDLSSELISWEDTAAAMKNLDIMISSCTSIPHMSGALGVKTWVIVPTLAYYMWSYPGDGTPWYESVKVFRQKNFREWTDPLIEVRENLKRT